MKILTFYIYNVANSEAKIKSKEFTDHYTIQY